MIFFQRITFRLVTPLTVSEYISEQFTQPNTSCERAGMSSAAFTQREGWISWFTIVITHSRESAAVRWCVPAFPVDVWVWVCVSARWWRMDDGVREFSALDKLFQFNMNECELERVARNALHCHRRLVNVVIIWKWWCACACIDYQHHSAQTDQSVDCCRSVRWHSLWHLIFHCPSSIRFQSLELLKSIQTQWRIVSALSLAKRPGTCWVKRQKTSVFHFFFSFISF